MIDCPIKRQRIERQREEILRLQQREHNERVRKCVEEFAKRTKNEILE